MASRKMSVLMATKSGKEEKERNREEERKREMER
jgi:hypothetical protein